LEPFAIDFIDIAAADAALNSSVDMVGRISSFSALGSVLSAIGPSVDPTNSYHEPTAAAVPSFKRSQQYRDTHYGSSTFLQALSLLRDRGHLKRILLNVGLIDSNGTGTAAAHTPYDSMTGLLEATLTLCSHISSCRDGANILLEYGVLNGLNCLPVLPLPSSQADPLQEFSTNLGGGRNNPPPTYTEDDIEVMLEPTLRLLNILGSTSPCHEVLRQCCLFLINNSQIISYYLHLRAPTLRGLRVVFSIVNLMCLIAPSTMAADGGVTEGGRGRGQGQREKSQSAVLYSSIWETEMGPKGDVYTADLCRLARVLGSKPLPNWNYVRRSGGSGGGGGKKDSSSSWWTAIKPSSPYEVQLSEDLIPPPNCLKLNGGRLGDHPTQWTRFDELRLMCGLRVLERIGSFFRMRSNLCVMTSDGLRHPTTSTHHQNHSLFTPQLNDSYASVGAGTESSVRSWAGNGMALGDVIGLSAINMEDLTFTFQSMTSFYVHVSSSYVNKEEENSHWLMESNTLSSPFYPMLNKRGGAEQTGERTLSSSSLCSDSDQEINKLLLYLSESLLCAIYDLLIIASPDERVTWTSDVTACLQITDKFPTHSFIRQISRYILSQINETAKRK
jgi:hypothetical protein